MTKGKYGLLGHPLGHSFSKEIHESIADYKYDIIDVDLDGFHKFMREKDFSAVNVTIPYKETVIPYIDVLDDMAKRIGAVNTVVNRDGKLYGYNTDIDGLRSLILRNTDSIEGKGVLILGSGGTAKTALFVAKLMSAGEIFVATGEPGGKSDAGAVFISYGDIEKIADKVAVIINATPVGMYPDIFASPVDLQMFAQLECVIDAVYNPLRTLLVCEAKKRGIAAEGGLYMLTAQAVGAVGHFLGVAHDDALAQKNFERVMEKRQNIVLIGMPASGKTTVGTALSTALGRNFIDTDAIIAGKFGKPSEIIEQSGEAVFRNIESDVIRSIAPKSGCVIATGGGAVLKSENVEALGMNGKFVFLDRSPAKLIPSPDRPLSRDREKLEKLYSERYEIYRSVADVRIDADGDVESTVLKILSYLE